MPEHVSGLRLRLFFHQFPQYIVAKRLGINPSILSLYAHGKRELTPGHLVLLAEYFSCSEEEILQFVETDAFDKVADSGVAT